MRATEILEAMPALTPEERAQVKALLDRPAAAPLRRMIEEEFACHLAVGGGCHFPEKSGDYDFHAHKPVEVKGTPLSPMITEEHRQLKL